MTTPTPGIQLGDHVYPAGFVAAAFASRDPEGYVLALHKAERLGYLKASDEWVNLAEPLPDRLQEAAHALVEAGRLPEFEEHFA